MTATADIASAPNEATPSQAYAETLDHLYKRAAETFAASTTSSYTSEAPEYRPDRTALTTIADPEVIADFADAPELRAVEELRTWLRLPYREVALVAGLSSPSLLHHWRQRHRTGSPVRTRASTVERLWRVHSLVRAVAEALQGADQSYAVQLWVRQEHDGVTPLELLLRGRLDEVELLARSLLFDHRPDRRSFGRTAMLEDNRDLEATNRPDVPSHRDSDFG